MIRTLAIVAALTLPAAAALAETYPSATPGAIAGRSPVQSYRSVEAQPACERQMHSLPAGKLPTYGMHALPAAACKDALLASAKSTVTRD